MLLTFIINFFRCLKHCLSIITILLILILIGAFIISKSEGIGIGNSIYFSFITAFTVGYGDVTPHTFLGKLSSVLVALTGILFFGVLTAISTKALNLSMKDQKKIHNQ